jgi:hypothetical protein
MRCMILLGCFLCVCLGGYLTTGVYRRKSRQHRLLLIGAIGLNALMLIIYVGEARANLRSLQVPELSRWLCSRSVLWPMFLLAATAVYYVLLIREERQHRENTIDRFSIKEGVDQISSGLCFCIKGGRVILANSRMNALCHTIAGHALQDAEAFWKQLSGGEVQPGVKRLAFGLYPSFRLPDGTVWSFAREELEGFIQLTAADTTQQQTLTDELRYKNLDLAALNLRLRRHGENVDALARSRERLETKVRIHGELGQALLAARRYLLDETNQEPPVDIWRRNIAMLRQEMESKKTEDPMQILRKAADSAGVKLNILGKNPEDSQYRQVFLWAASEALTNAVFHAGASTLNVTLTETDNGWSMRFTNDGDRPAKSITEGGGLSTLRRKLESIGASMTVESFPAFVLLVTGRKGENA